MAKNIFITGASSDIGIATLRELIKRDGIEAYQIYAHYNRSDEKLLALAEEFPGLSIETIQADLTNPTEVKTLASVVSEKEISYFLHFPALPFDYMRFKQMDFAHIKKEMEVSVYSFLALGKELFPKMKKVENSRALVMLTSFITEEHPPKFMVDYLTTKYALLGAMKAAAEEFGGGNLLINGISPEMMETKFLDQIDPKIKEMNAMKRESGKLVTPEEVAPYIVEMISETYQKNGVNKVLEL